MSEMNVQENAPSSEGTVECETEMELPIYYKKKVLPLKECEDIKRLAKDLMEKNKQDSIHQKSMLEKITDKHDEFVAMLERKLEDYKQNNIAEINLQRDDLLPRWEPVTEYLIHRSHRHKPEHIKRLLEWKKVMDSYVNLQRSNVAQVIENWFDEIDEVKSTGESDAYTTKSQSSPTPAEVSIIPLILFVFLVLVYIAHAVRNPEDVSECTDHPGKCLSQELMKHLIYLHNEYLKFHNITLEEVGISLLNSSTTAAELE